MYIACTEVRVSSHSYARLMRDIDGSIFYGRPTIVVLWGFFLNSSPKGARGPSQHCVIVNIIPTHTPKFNCHRYLLIIVNIGEPSLCMYIGKIM